MAPLIWSSPLHAKAPLRSREESSPSPLPLSSPSMSPQFIFFTDLVTKPKSELYQMQGIRVSVGKNNHNDLILGKKIKTLIANLWKIGTLVFSAFSSFVRLDSLKYIGKLGRNKKWSTLRIRYFMDIEELIVILRANLVSEQEINRRSGTQIGYEYELKNVPSTKSVTRACNHVKNTEERKREIEIKPIKGAWSWIEVLCVPMNTTNLNLQIEWTARNGTPAPCPSRARALDVDFVIKKRVARPGYLGRTAARSTPILIWTIIYRCEAMGVSFPTALESSHLDLCSSNYDQNSDRRSGLTALGEFLRTNLRMRIRHRIA
ncbi:hypothetical protein PIB30_069922 [Stylosanthes scabra]|uniref:Uncharacterized protein n=1 Tax=Stylosanthes scabra TaxID=79078 RepID=A0ABU6RNA7_9FABA|nr:hypothetical protein [Stylosanthes scabra]